MTGPLRPGDPGTLGALLVRAARSHGDRPYLREATAARQAITYREVRDFACGMDEFLSEAGVGAGRTVAMLLPNSVTAAAIFLGVVAAGRRLVPINPKASAAEARYIAEIAEAQWVFGAREAREIDEAWGSAGRTLDVGWDFVRELTARGRDRDGEALELGAAQDDAEIIFTSGSTGRPKGGVLSHHALLSNSLALARAYDIGPDDRFLTACPLFHNSGQIFTVLSPAWLGAETVIARSEVALLKLRDMVEKFGITWSLVVNAYLALLADKSGVAPFPDGFRGILSGGSRLSASLIEKFEAMYGTRVYQVYGLTETTSIATCERPTDTARSIGSAGSPLPIGELIVDGGAEGGEILFRGANLFTRYLGDPELTERVLADGGWFRTGDIGRIDENGNLFITDRVDNLLFVGGENVYPADVEILAPHIAGVREMVLIGVDGGVLGTELCLVYETTPGHEPDKEDIRTVLRGNLAAFKIPRHVLSVAELGRPELPRAANGKIQRGRIADLVRTSIGGRT